MGGAATGVSTLRGAAIGGSTACTTTVRVVDRNPPENPPPPANPPPANPPPPATPPPPPPAHAEKHPAYLHALSDLRDARFNLIRKGGDAEMKWDEREA